jgi:hypothetical protein
MEFNSGFKGLSEYLNKKIVAEKSAGCRYEKKMVVD